MNQQVVMVLAVAAIYYIWRMYSFWLTQRRATIRRRVSYMLWVAAQRVR
jgi:hypothetical protein